MIEFSLHIARPEDVSAIQSLMYPGYFQESTYSGLTYDHDQTRAMIENWLHDVCIVAKVEGRIVGVAAMYYVRTFYKEPEADVEMFYVAPEYRGTGISRALVDTLVQNADANRCAVIYTSCASGISEKNNLLYRNLFKKFGFNVLGTELARVKHV